MCHYCIQRGRGIWGLAFIMCNLVKQFIILKESKFTVKLSLYNFIGKRYEETKEMIVDNHSFNRTPDFLTNRITVL